MRIAITNWSNRVVGGAERYIASIADYLLEQGHELGFWYEVDEPADRELIPAIARGENWHIGSLGLERALERLRRWAPNVLYCQSMRDPGMAAKLLDIAPSVFFAHDHTGICISGTRTTYFPTIQPCNRPFGRSCLLNFFPHRCGGMNPVTMLEDYDLNSRRLKVLKRYSRVLTHSDAMQKQYQMHGVDAHKVRFFVDRQDRDVTSVKREERPQNEPWRLLMIGRMTETKGGKLLLESLPSIAKRVPRTLEVTFAGDGPSRAAWQQRAAETERNFPQIRIRFTGWLDGRDCQETYRNADLLTLPSIWAEPFGMVGLEAGLAGVPCVAFPVGGVSQWLVDGVNGCLAQGENLNAESFGEAVTRALSDEKSFQKLRSGARSMAVTWTIQQHYEDLLAVFQNLQGEHRLVAS
jgi:glycosyltransferase involved in cell wall biosynthesis